MDIYEISDFRTGRDESGVNFLDPAQTFDVFKNGYVYRQALYSRLGFDQFGDRLSDNTRVLGIFENIVPNGTTQLLVCSTNFLYEYDSGTNTFTQIVNAGSAPALGFGISDPADYVSGTTYLTKTGAKRFVFTSHGMTDVYYYDGTDVRSFTLDNADYAAPIDGALTGARKVFWFGERLNFIVPRIAGSFQNQTILFSGIRDSSGNGDKFNVPGSGTVIADTYENMLGALILGDLMVLNFDRSTWALEKTRDVFNPYFIRKIPSVLGTNAGFSAVQWNYEIKSAGITGLISTDGRQSKRFDNLVPYFTSNEIDGLNFDLTYGGFDRVTGQFLFSYRSFDSQLTDITQDKVLAYNYEEGTFSIYDLRFSVFGQTDVGQDLIMNEIYEVNQLSWISMNTTEEIMNKIGVEAASQKTLAGDNYGLIYEINKDFDDYFSSISAITAASSAVATISGSELKIGDRVIFEDVEGMVEINGQIATVSAASTTSITVDIDTTLYTAYTGGGNLSKLISFEAQFVPFNPYRAEGRQCYVSHLEFLVNTHVNGFTVEIFIDGETTAFKTAQVVSSQTSVKSREWVTVIVNQEANFVIFKLSNESSSNQTIVTAIRIHCDRGLLTSG